MKLITKQWLFIIVMYIFITLLYLSMPTVNDNKLLLFVYYSLCLLAGYFNDDVYNLIFEDINPLQFKDLFYNEKYKLNRLNGEQWLAFNSNKEVIISIIKGPHSYGGSEGLYEMWDYRNKAEGPIGYLTIDDINEHLRNYPINT